MLVHATCVALDGWAVLLRGPSGAGKSDLGLRLIDRGARLVADDQVALEEDGGRIMARPPAALAGQLEVRGLGIVDVGHLAHAPVVLIVDLVDPATIERLPEDASETLLGVAIPRLALAPFEASAPAKLRVALTRVAAHIVASPPIVEPATREE